RRALLPRTAIALLTGQFERVQSLSPAAIQKNPDMPFIRWFQIHPLVESGEHEAALRALDALAEVLTPTHPDFIAYTKMLRASILQRMGQAGRAADLYLELLE